MTGIGPAFDTMTLARPTPRRLAGLWMDQAGLRTLVLPQVWRELADDSESPGEFTTATGWAAMRELPDAPFHWLELTPEQNQMARAIRGRFTEACFPRTPADRIERHSDAIIVSQALAAGTDVLVTGDIATIDHREINNLVSKAWGRSVGFVTTMDDALLTAYPGGECAERLLVLALATVAPFSPARPATWSVGEAFDSLGNLRRALIGAGMANVSARLLTRWEQARDLDCVVEESIRLAEGSKALEFERLRVRWHRLGRVELPPRGEPPNPEADRRG